MQPKTNQVVSGALYDFMGYLTTRPKVISVGKDAEVYDLMDAFRKWSATRKLDVGKALTQDWTEHLGSDAPRLNPDLIEDVRAFGEKYGLPLSDTPHLLMPKDWAYRFQFLQEELSETQDAYEQADLAEVADGLIDLIYVALGTLQLMGVPIAAGWQEVQRANMTKHRVSRKEDSKRGHVWDIVKPPDWTPPDWETILAQPTQPRTTAEGWPPPSAGATGGGS